VLLHGADVRNLFHDGRLTAHQPSPEARIAAGDEGPILVYDLGVERPLFGAGDVL
jgi:hypothetical protein